jgi:hypothetical protein
MLPLALGCELAQGTLDVFIPLVSNGLQCMDHDIYY